MASPHGHPLGDEVGLVRVDVQSYPHHTRPLRRLGEGPEPRGEVVLRTVQSSRVAARHEDVLGNATDGALLVHETGPAEAVLDVRAEEGVHDLLEAALGERVHAGLEDQHELMGLPLAVVPLLVNTGQLEACSSEARNELCQAEVPALALEELLSGVVLTSVHTPPLRCIGLWSGYFSCFILAYSTILVK